MQLYAKPPQNAFATIVIPDDVPAYQIQKGKFFGVDSQGLDHLYLAGEVILYWEEPNLQMKPLNKLAWEEMDIFLDKLDKLGMQKAKEDKRGYVPQKAAFKAAHAPANKSSRRGVVTLGGDDPTPLMGNRHRKEGQVETLAPEEATQQINVVGAAGKAAVNAVNQ